ncbi:TPA: hypothetical protein DCW54_00250, partial [Candidatus Dependentiae bacterium]|nr:hypothetical protein [Candidatus Dependentiae bacterium]
AAAAREIRTPLPTLWGFTHYPVQYHWEQDPDKDGCWSWDLDASAVGYYRSTDKAYRKDRCKEEFTTLIFGKSDFRLGEAYPDAHVAADQLLNNPYVDISTISPRFEYREGGAIFGLQVGAVATWCDTDYRFGLRAKLPFRDIEVSDTCAMSDLVGEGLGDLWQVRKEKNGTTENLVYAGRLDFLTRLNRLGVINSPIVVYGNEATAPARTTMAAQVVSAPVLGDGLPPVELLYSDNGTMPTATVWAATTIPATALPADGSASAGSRHYFKGYNNVGPVVGTDYTALGTNTVAQSKLFVVPSLKDAANAEITDAAKTIRSAVETAISNLDSLDDFMAEQGLSFCNGRQKGFGDLDLELYLGRNWGCEDSLWTDVMFGVRLPTADRLCNCKLLLAQPLGNNEHWEVRGALAAGYDICDWVKFMLDASYSWALKHKEQVAAPFKGATIQNIGPCVDANIKWDYFLGHADLTFFANDCCGLDIGYELYHKRCDNVSLCVSTALPLGYAASATKQSLDGSVLRSNTERTAHKARVSIFTTLGDCTLEGGWSHTFAGKRAPRDTDFYLNLGVAF